MAPTAPAAAAPSTVVFLELVPATGYWIGVANHACADPEYIHVPAHCREALTPNYCGGVDAFYVGEPLCPCCTAKNDTIPF